MNETYNFKETEPRIVQLWKQGSYFTPPQSRRGRTYSMFLMPPNASGPMHIGNAFMVAIQDILARYHRAKGDATIWIPGTDHGGYETQVTFERELEERGDSKDHYSNAELFKAIEQFVKKNNETIKAQTHAMGASVDWSRFRYTLDENSLQFVENMFRKMVSDELIYRGSYMVNYCTACATVLADIELKEQAVTSKLFFIKFPFKNREKYCTLATTEPEFLFTVTHVLVHPQDERYAGLIGETLINPSTGAEVKILASKRKFDPKNPEPHLSVFLPSSVKYDFEYAIRNNLPSKNLLDWDGTLLERHPGISPQEAREREFAQLTAGSFIEHVEEHADIQYVCKKGHMVRSMIRMTWFLDLDGEKFSLRKKTLETVQRERPIIQPHWREKGLLEWIGKMHDWPIARQNVWGIRIPLWYEVDEPSQFTVWYRDQRGQLHNGNLKTFLDGGATFEEIAGGLERIYAAEGSHWTLECEAGKRYLPETDKFDTWFSSCAWGMIVFDHKVGLSDFYPCTINVLGYDLLRLFVAREMFFGTYLLGRLPFRRVYFHSLIKGSDGQKMSKSLGNAVTLDEYLEKYGADVTRMALISYTSTFQDFMFEAERLRFFSLFSQRLWTIGRVCDTANTYAIGPYVPELLTPEDRQLLSRFEEVKRVAGSSVEKYQFAQAQEKLTAFLLEFETFCSVLLTRDSVENGAALLLHMFKEYLIALHPFMPFLTEELYSKLYRDPRPLAAYKCLSTRR